MYVDLIGHLDKGKALRPTDWEPELRQAKNQVDMFGSKNVKASALEIIGKIERKEGDRAELQRLIDEKLKPEMKKDLTWWKFW